VKLLDAADNLSVQIHPDDHYEGLGPEECGKPESWYVLDAEPGAGLYLALAPHTTPEAMRKALEESGDVASLLGFVPVETGDFFVVEAGTAHAIGRGVTLIEPQIVRPGRKGVTYRYWDWNRRYDAKGVQSPEGTPRALHVAHALAVTDWSRTRGESFLAETRVRAGRCDVRSAVTLTKLCAREGAPLRSVHLDVSRLAGTGTLTHAAHGRLRALTVAEGEVVVCAGNERVIVSRGRSAAIAAGAVVRFEAQGAHAVLSSVA
jgi:mannose-6-phosphate isomerase